MGLLKPGVTYVYERQGGVVYAREEGAPFEDRIIIGYDWEPESNPVRVRGTIREEVEENQLWYQIRQEADNNPVLKDALERVKILYYLGKKNNGGET